MRLLAPLLLLAACGAPTDPAPPLLECERLAFVPPGVVARGPLAGSGCGTPVALLVDRFEVTRALWRQVAGRHPGVPDLRGRVGQDGSQPLEGSLPAVGMDYDEAQRLARARDMRLPTAGEWIYIASGVRGQYYPWGNSLVASASNTWELGLGRPAAAGSFPSGATAATGVHDMIGNVWEWTAPPLIDGFLPLGWQGQDLAPHPRWAMGGSYLYLAHTLFEVGRPPRVNAQGREVGSYSGDVGLRCVVAAETYLRARAADWGAPELRARVVAVGQVWGARSVRLLEGLAAEPGASDALGWLLEGARR